MPAKGKLYLRYNQKYVRDQYKDAEVGIYAPQWVEAALKKLSAKIFVGGADQFEFEIFEPPRNNLDFSFSLRGGAEEEKGEAKPVHTLTITKEKGLTLVDLIALARNPAGLGLEMTASYPDEFDLAGLKALAKHCIILGKNKASAPFGVGSSFLKELDDEEDKDGGPGSREPKLVYVCDLPVFDFSNRFGGENLFFISQGHSLSETERDSYEKTVGKPQADYATAADPANMEKYLGFQDGGEKLSYFDLEAYKKFIAQDLILAGTALDQVAGKNGHQVKFNFLAYVAAFLSAPILNSRLPLFFLQAVKEGLGILFLKIKNTHIKQIELPGFDWCAAGDLFISIKEEIRQLCKKNGFSCVFADSNNPFAPSTWTDPESKNQLELISAATNSASLSWPAGGSKVLFSADGTIAEALEDHADSLSVICKDNMPVTYLDLSLVAPAKRAQIKPLPASSALDGDEEEKGPIPDNMKFKSDLHLTRTTEASQIIWLRSEKNEDSNYVCFDPSVRLPLISKFMNEQLNRAIHLPIRPLALAEGQLKPQGSNVVRAVIYYLPEVEEHSDHVPQGDLKKVGRIEEHDAARRRVKSTLVFPERVKITEFKGETKDLSANYIRLMIAIDEQVRQGFKLLNGKQGQKPFITIQTLEAYPPPNGRPLSLLERAYMEYCLEKEYPCYDQKGNRIDLSIVPGLRLGSGLNKYLNDLHAELQAQRAARGNIKRLPRPAVGFFDGSPSSGPPANPGGVPSLHTSRRGPSNS